MSGGGLTIERKIIATKLGSLEASASAGTLLSLRWILQKDATEIRSIHDSSAEPSETATELFLELEQQVTAFFDGRLQTFDLPFLLTGTPFQMKVWQVLLDLKYGQTATYKQIAIEIGQPTAVRAVGQANRRNPLVVLIPCHRVVQSSGQGTAYMGNHQQGAIIKQQLLELEQSARFIDSHFLVKI